MSDTTAATEPAARKTNYRQLFTFAVCCAMLCWLFEHPIQPVFADTNQNTLLLGESAIAEGDYSVAVEPPADFSGMTIEEILRRRVKAVWQQPLLIGVNYRPAEAVFCRLRNRADWRSYGPPFTAEQASVGSEYVLNPYLLVAAEIEIDGESAPYFPPRSIEWSPHRAHAEVVYDVSTYLATTGTPLDELAWQLVTLNARDMNFNFAAILPGEAVAMQLPRPSLEPVPIRQFLWYRAGGGKAARRFNEVGPADTRFTGLQVHSLPAGLTVRLWRNPPRTVTEPPDVRFVVRFE